MKRSRGRVQKILLATLLLMGVSLQGVAALLCTRSACPLEIKTESKPSCCQKKALPPASKSPSKQGSGPCCCELQAPQAANSVSLGDLSTSLLLLDFVPVVTLNTGEFVAALNSDRAQFWSDGSPPHPERHPDLGRAPPAN